MVFTSFPSGFLLICNVKLESCLLLLQIGDCVETKGFTAPTSFNIPIGASVWKRCALSNVSHGRVNRGTLVASVVLSLRVPRCHHVQILFSLTASTGADWNLLSFSVIALLKERAINLHFPVQSWEEANIFRKEPYPQLQAWQPSKGQIPLNGLW